MRCRGFPSAMCEDGLPGARQDLFDCLGSVRTCGDPHGTAALRAGQQMRLSPNSAVQPPVPTASASGGLVRRARKETARIQSADPDRLGDVPRKISV